MTDSLRYRNDSSGSGVFMVWQVGQCIRDRYQLLSLKRDRPGHQVWLALDQQSQTKVILKTLAFTGEIQWDEVKLFEREIEALKQLQHPRLPAFVDAFSQEQPYFRKCLVETYIHAPALQAFLDRTQAIPKKQVWAIATQILTILQDLHQFSPPILHRDLKPSNILIDAQKQVYLIDLGSVGQQTIEKRDPLDPPTTVGSYGYTPIEQFMGQATPASDLYALGATLMQLLTTTPPADLLNPQLRLTLPQDLDVSAPLRQWLYDLTEPKVTHRLSSAEQALRSLQQSQSQAHTLANDPTNPRVTLTTHSDSQQLIVRPYWNSDSIASTDIVLLTALGLLPPVLGVGWAIAIGASTQGFGLLGTEILVLGGALLPAGVVVPKLFWKLLRQTIILRSKELHIQWRILGILVRQSRLKKNNIISFQIVPEPADTWSIIARCRDRRLPITLRLHGQDVERIYQILEPWFN